MRSFLFLICVLLATPVAAQHRHVHKKKTVKKTVNRKVVKKAKKNRHKVYVKSRGFRYGYESRHRHKRVYRPYRTKSYYRHIHSDHCPPSHDVNVRVVIVEKSFSPPALSCPARTHQASNGLTQWCETKRGTRHGSYREWRKDGSLAVTGEYQYDAKEDVWLFYHQNGVISREIIYQNGSATGVSHAWDQDGNVISVTTYE